jgi:polar amino acid transport system substrate-binding protein
MSQRAKPTRQRCVARAGAVLVIAAGCATTNGRVAPTFSTRATSTTVIASTTTTSPSERRCVERHLETASLNPTGPLIQPGHMPAGSYMERILHNGMLIAGVDQNTFGFGYRDPATGHIEGFDIDMLREVARAIFGNPNKVAFRAVTSQQRIPAVAGGMVDIVASVMSMTCDRWEKVDFSSEYFRGYQSVLVRSDSPIHTLADLAHRTVCATRGSTSLDQIHQVAPRAITVPVDTRTDCLVALQEGTVDAISTDDTILWGFQVQDPNTRLVALQRPDQIHVEPYGIAIARNHPEFVRFVNAVLARVRADGTWDREYAKLRARLTARFNPPRVQVPPASPPAPVYGRLG